MTATAEKRPETGFEPRIVVFVCNWCTYAGADLTGTSRLRYPANIRIIKLPCTGRIDPLFVLKAFEGGADAVLVSGCHPGDCHYTNGNYHARRRWAVFRKLLAFTGIGEDRLFFSWVSAAEGRKFAELISDITAKVKAAGPFKSHNPAGRPSEVGETAMRCPPVGKSPGKGPAIGPDTAPAQVLALVNLVEAIRTDAARLLKESRVKLVIGHQLRGTCRQPVFIAEPGRVSGLAHDELCVKNLAAYLRKPEIRRQFPAAVVASPAVCRSLVLLAAESQLEEKDAVILAAGPNEYHGALNLAGTSKLLKEKYPDLAPDKKLVETISKLDSLTAEERSEFWRLQFSKCTRCYACRAACPGCYCRRCIVEKNVPQWISSMADGHGNYAWNIIRAFHLAGRCTLCGSCEAACPQGIPIMLFNTKVDSIVLEEFKTKAGPPASLRAGYDITEKPFIGSWSPEDDNTFIK